MGALQIIFEHIYFAYPIIFILMFVEGGDGTLLASGFLIRLGFLNFFIVYPMALIAVFLRDIILYRLGERYGEELVTKFGRFFFVTPARLAKLEARLKNSGGKTIFFSKFFYGLNHITIMAVGAIKFDFRRFLKIESVTIFLWGTLMLTLGFFLGHSFTLFGHYAKDIALLLTAVLVPIILLAEFSITSKVLLFCRGNNDGRAAQRRNFQKGALTIIALLLIIVAAGAAFYFRANLLSEYRKLIFGSGLFQTNDLTSKTPVENLSDRLEKSVSTPTPLRQTRKAAAADLTNDGVIKWTNAQRASAGLTPLKGNPALDLAAAIKAEDILERQYFTHDSPGGQSPADLAKMVNYEFVAIGENLAMGNFDGDMALVEAWMESPGHRANILGDYADIGVAVIQGVFENSKTWIAVQEFGRPLSDCPQIDKSLEARITDYKDEIAILNSVINVRQAKLAIPGFQTKKEYETKIKEYNGLVKQYNGLIAATKSLIDEYNRQVRLFNQCAKR
ncbi:MAG: hypothetical protein HY813_01135 [Candidatus Portnoybacteria bacterium]|nr:hypothetical protein [Candidatus Portnoybacteria bacterium]